MKLLILGSQGQLGKAFVSICSKNKVEFEAPKEDKANICNFPEIEKLVENSDCTHLVNCAAYNDVDKAEEDGKVAFLVNAEAVKNLAQICQNMGICFTHFSTDYVFDGESSKAYNELDQTSPLSVYGKSKLQGEKNALEFCKKALLLRTSWVFGEGNNFIEKVILWSKNGKLKIAEDECSSPTSASSLAEVALALMQKEEYGLFQVCSHNGCTRFDFAKYILTRLNVEIEMERVSKDVFNLPAQRPTFSLMSVNKVEIALGKKLAYWEEEVNDYLQKGILKNEM